MGSTLNFLNSCCRTSKSVSMGSVNMKEMADVLDDDVPATPVMEKRTLDAAFDPRSPTSDITRTPIHIDRTPDVLLDPRSPTSGIERTPIHAVVRPRDLKVTKTETSSVEKVEEIFDPRSPTIGIDRTPLYVRAKDSKVSQIENSMDNVEEMLDPRSPTFGIARTPLYLKSQDREVVNKDDLSIIEKVKENLDLQRGSPERLEEIRDPRSPTTGIERTPVLMKPLEKESNDEGATEELRTSENKDETDNDDSAAVLSLATACAQEENVTKGVTSPTTPTTTECVRRRNPTKQLFKAEGDTSNSSIQRSPFKILDENDSQSSPTKVIEKRSRSPGPRSPLKVIDNSPRSVALNPKRKLDVNSPRAIVQRKQATKLSSKLSCTIQASQGQQRSPARSPARSARGSPGSGFTIFQDDKENM